MRLRSTAWSPRIDWKRCDDRSNRSVSFVRISVRKLFRPGSKVRKTLILVNRQPKMESEPDF